MTIMLENLSKKRQQWQGFKENLKSSKYWLYALVETLETILVACFFALLIRHYIAQTSLVFSGSMIPTMKINDRLVVNKLAYVFRTPNRGEIILFKSPHKDKKQYVKRLVGLPGETIAIKQGIVYINGKQLIFPGVNLKRDYSSFGPEKIPPNCYFVLGDNRGNSADSRIWGYVPHDELIGKAVFTFWPLKNAQVLR